MSWSRLSAGGWRFASLESQSCFAPMILFAVPEMTVSPTCRSNDQDSRTLMTPTSTEYSPVKRTRSNG